MDAPWSFGPTSVAAFIAFLGILIFVHELGHFLAAKYFDIKVVKFSIGFGPPILAFRRGETTYQIALVPLGGFVKMVGYNPGDEIAPEDELRSFGRAPLYQRAIIAFAGPLFNLGFPVICFFAYNLLGPMVLSPVVGQVELGQPAQAAGFETGDRIVEIEGQRTWSFDGIQRLISARPGLATQVVVERDGKPVALEVTPRSVPSRNALGTRYDRGMIGVSPRRAGTSIGVAFPDKNTGGFKTGDRILSVGGQPAANGDEAERLLRAQGGEQVRVMVARPVPKSAGDLIYATAAQAVALEVRVPAGFKKMEDLGLASSDAFIRSLIPGGAAERAGLREGDQVLAVGGKPIRLFYSLLTEARVAKDQPFSVEVRRGGQVLRFSVVNDASRCIQQASKNPDVYYDAGFGRGPLPKDAWCQAMAEPSFERRAQLLSYWPSGAPPEVEKARLGLGESLVTSVRQTVDVIASVGLAIVKLMTRDISLDHVGGPIQIFKLAAQAAELGVFRYLELLAAISVNLGLINLLPIPVFDGGHLMFCGIEAIKRKPISLRTRNAASILGLVLVLALLALALRNDILSLGVL